MIPYGWSVSIIGWAFTNSILQTQNVAELKMIYILDDMPAQFRPLI